MSANEHPETGKATAEQSQEIEQLITALEIEKKRHPEEDFFLWLKFGKLQKAIVRPNPRNFKAWEIVIRSNGLIYEAQGEKWKIISHGLGAAMTWTHHTHPLLAVDLDEIAEHIAESVKAWLEVNWSNGQAFHVLDAITRRLQVNAQWTPSDHVASSITSAAHHMEVAIGDHYAALTRPGVSEAEVMFSVNLLQGAAGALGVASNLVARAVPPFAAALNPPEDA